MRLALILTGLTLASAARADDAALQAQVFGHALGKDAGFACFSRVYDKPHLASHPKQNVTSIMLLVKGVTEDSVHYNASVDFRFRKSGKHFQAYGECPSVAVEGSKPGELHCGIDCDGGTINVNLKDADTLLVKLPDGIAVSDPADANDQGPSMGRFGSDDKVFKLTRVSGSNCLPLAAEDADKAALKALK